MVMICYGKALLHHVVKFTSPIKFIFYIKLVLSGVVHSWVLFTLRFITLTFLCRI